MPNKIATKVWVSTSPEVQKVLKNHIDKTAETLVYNAYGITHTWTANEINQCVVKILTDLDGIDLPLKNKPYKLAKVLKDAIFVRFDEYSLDWEECKNAKIQSERLMILNQIIGKKVSTEEDLLPDEIRALEDSFCAEDVPIAVRRSTYRIFLEGRTKELIQNLKKNIYSDSTEDIEQRQSDVIELHKLTGDLDILSAESQEESRKAINKAWGLEVSGRIL